MLLCDLLLFLRRIKKAKGNSRKEVRLFCFLKISKVPSCQYSRSATRLDKQRGSSPVSCELPTRWLCWFPTLGATSSLFNPFTQHQLWEPGSIDKTEKLTGKVQICILPDVFGAGGLPFADIVAVAVCSIFSCWSSVFFSLCWYPWLGTTPKGTRLLNIP